MSGDPERDMQPEPRPADAHQPQTPGAHEPGSGTTGDAARSDEAEPRLPDTPLPADLAPSDVPAADLPAAGVSAAGPAAAAASGPAAAAASGPEAAAATGPAAAAAPAPGSEPVQGAWRVTGPSRRRGWLATFLVAALGAVAGSGLTIAVLMPEALLGRDGTPVSTAADTAAAEAGSGGARAPSPTLRISTAGPVESVIADVAEQVSPSVVAVINKQEMRSRRSGETRLVEAGVGSGVILRPDGYIVTNYHVVEGADAIEVVLDEDQRWPAELVAHDYPYSDLAVLKVDAGNLPAAVLGNSDNLRPGETVLAIGHPQGLDFFRSVTVGVVSGVRTDLLQSLRDRTGQFAQSRIFEVIQTDAAISPGNSGGPLVNLRGEVIGINTLKFRSPGVEGMGFALASNEVARVVEDLIRQGYVTRPALGVTVESPVFDEDVFTGEGVRVTAVQPGSGAERAGIQPGDVIVAVQGEEVRTFTELIKAVNRYRVGDVVTVTVERDGRRLDLQVELGQLQS